MPLKNLVMLCLATLLAAAGCSSNPTAVQRPSSKMIVATTMSTLASLVQTVAGDRATVVNLVPVGVSPEDYQPTPRDIATLSSARILVENGSGLESWLRHTIESAKNPGMQIVVCTDGMPVVGGNPHLWMNPQYAKTYVNKITASLEAADPAGKSSYEANAASERAQLDRLDHWIAGRIKTIPAAHRNMVVFHNAWQYYNARYGITTVGAIELSPGQEPSPQYIAKLIALAKANHVRAIFAEPEYSQKLAKSLASDAGIAVVSNLYDDSLGASGPVHDYESMLRFDTNTIVDALK